MYQNIISLIVMLLLLPLLLIVALVKTIAAVIIYPAQLLLDKHYDKSKEWEIIKIFNRLGKSILD